MIRTNHSTTGKKSKNFLFDLPKNTVTARAKKLGGDLGWVDKAMPIPEQILTQELKNEIMKLEKFIIPEPIQSKLGFHIIIICESQVHSPRKKTEEKETRPLF